jgi:hypothetical protein
MAWSPSTLPPTNRVLIRQASNRLLAQPEEGEAKAQAALALANTCEKLGRRAEAIPWLSGVSPSYPIIASCKCTWLR